MILKDGLVLYWKLDGDSRDSLDINDGVDTNMTYTSGKLNQCGDFNGTSSYISSVGNGLPSGGDARTYAAWVYPISYTSPTGCIIYAGNSSTPPNQSFNLYQADLAGVYYIFSDAVNSANNLSVPIQDLAPLNEWSFICFTLENDNYVYYLNGVARLSGTFTIPINTYTSSIVVGNRQDSYPGFWDGLIDEVGIWNRSLSPQEVYRIYNNGVGRQYPFQKIIMPNTSLENSLISYWKLDGNSNDYVGSNNGVNTNISYTPGKINNSAIFNGTTSKITLDQDSLNFGEDFSISTWIYPTDVSLTDPYAIVSNYSYPPGVDGIGWYLSIWKDVGIPKIYFLISYSLVSTSIPLFSTTTIAANTWYHVVVTRKQGTRSRIYINGVLDNSDTNTNDPIYPATINSAIGVATIATGVDIRFFKGQIDEVGIWGKELDQSEISKLYNDGKGYQYPFRRMLSQNNTSLVQGLVSFWKLDGNSLDSVGSNHGTDTNVSYVDGKVKESAYFNGVQFASGGRIAVGTDSSFNFIHQTEIFSVSFWLKLNNVASPNGIIMASTHPLVGSPPPSGVGLIAAVGSDGSVFVEVQITPANNTDGVYASTPPGTISDNNFHHYVFTIDRSVTTSKVYIDGVYVTTTDAGLWGVVGGDANILTLGSWAYAWGSYQFVLGGNLDEVGIWDRVLTQEEVTYLYNNGHGKSHPFLTNLLKH